MALRYTQQPRQLHIFRGPANCPAGELSAINQLLGNPSLSLFSSPLAQSGTCEPPCTLIVPPTLIATLRLHALPSTAPFSFQFKKFFGPLSALLSLHIAALRCDSPNPLSTPTVLRHGHPAAKPHTVIANGQGLRIRLHPNHVCSNFAAVSTLLTTSQHVGLMRHPSFSPLRIRRSRR